MIPTYDCAHFLGETLASVLADDPGADVMQIEVVDDASRDDPAKVVQDVGKGRVALWRQPRNVGHVRNFNTCLLRSRGHLVHLLHGDDLVRPGFYAAMAAPLHGNPDVGAAFCRYEAIDERGRRIALAGAERKEAGVIDSWLERIGAGQRLQPPTMVVRRSVYETLGGFDDRLTVSGEDWEMWVRIAARSPVWYEPMMLAAYRVHPQSLSGRAQTSGADIRDLRRVIAMNAEVLPHALARTISASASRELGRAVARRANRRLDHGDLTFPGGALREGLRATRDPWVVAALLRFVIRWARARVTTAARRGLPLDNQERPG
jgi:glycosyltransferase involved in cell wall biosynthesis